MTESDPAGACHMHGQHGTAAGAVRIKGLLVSDVSLCHTRQGSEPSWAKRAQYACQDLQNRVCCQWCLVGCVLLCRSGAVQMSKVDQALAQRAAQAAKEAASSQGSSFVAIRNVGPYEFGAATNIAPQLALPDSAGAPTALHGGPLLGVSVSTGTNQPDQLLMFDWDGELVSGALGHACMVPQAPGCPSLLRLSVDPSVVDHPAAAEFYVAPFRVPYRCVLQYAEFRNFHMCSPSSCDECCHSCDACMYSHNVCPHCALPVRRCGRWGRE